MAAISGSQGTKATAALQASQQPQKHFPQTEPSPEEQRNGQNYPHFTSSCEKSKRRERANVTSLRTNVSACPTICEEMIEVKEREYRGVVKVHRDLLFFWRDASHSSSKTEGSGHEE